MFLRMRQMTYCRMLIRGKERCSYKWTKVDVFPLDEPSKKQLSFFEDHKKSEKDIFQQKKQRSLPALHEEKIFKGILQIFL